MEKEINVHKRDSSIGKESSRHIHPILKKAEYSYVVDEVNEE